MLQRSAHQDSNATLPYVLYSVQNLTYDHHELTLSSRGNGGLLLDFIQTTVQLAPKGATVENQTLEETDGRIKYEGEWGNNQSGNEELLSEKKTRFDRRQVKVGRPHRHHRHRLPLAPPFSPPLTLGPPLFRKSPARLFCSGCTVGFTRPP